MVWKRRKWNGRNGENGKRIIYAMLVDEIKTLSMENGVNIISSSFSLQLPRYHRITQKDVQLNSFFPSIFFSSIFFLTLFAKV